MVDAGSIEIGTEVLHRGYGIRGVVVEKRVQVRIQVKGKSIWADERVCEVVAAAGATAGAAEIPAVSEGSVAAPAIAAS
jgi:hypothetical protein